MVEGELLGVVSEHVAHLVLCEAHHLVESVCKRIIGADVESAGEVIEGHRADTCDEYALNGRVCACLDGVKECAQVACAVSLPLVFFEARGIGEDMVGEVVVFVYEEVYFKACLGALVIQIV